MYINTSVDIVDFVKWDLKCKKIVKMNHVVESSCLCITSPMATITSHVMY